MPEDNGGGPRIRRRVNDAPDPALMPLVIDDVEVDRDEGTPLATEEFEAELVNDPTSNSSLVCPDRVWILDRDLDREWECGWAVVVTSILEGVGGTCTIADEYPSVDSTGWNRGGEGGKKSTV